MQITRAAGLLVAVAVGGCSGRADLSDQGDQTRLSPNSVVGVSGVRRLSRTEYDDTLRDLLGDATSSGFAMLPPDTHDPFDNDYRTQLTSPTLIEALETLATNAAADQTFLIAPRGRRDRTEPFRWRLRAMRERAACSWTCR